MAAWNVVAKPEGNNPGVVRKAAAAVGVGSIDPPPENIGGMIISVSDGTSMQEVSRVAYIRRPTACRNPNTTYRAQLEIELDKARATCEKLNALLGIPEEVAA
jgi:hypothetical protein